MYSKNFGGPTLIAFGAFQNAPDEFLLEFRDRFFQQNAAVNHHPYQRFKLIFQVRTLRGST